MAESSNHPTERGFSLLEVLITAVIIGVLAAVAVPVVNNIRDTGSSGAASGSVSSLVNEFQIAYTLGEDIVTDTNPTISDGAIPIYTDRSGQKVTRSVGGLEAVDAGFDGSAITCLSGQQDGYIATWTSAAGMTVAPGDTLACTNTPANTGQNGTGSASSTTPTPTPTLTPTAPAPVTAAAVTRASPCMTITWEPVEGAVFYRVSHDGGANWVEVPVTAQPSTEIVCGTTGTRWATAYGGNYQHAFSTGGAYDYRIKVVNSSGLESSELRVTRPDAPTNVTAARNGTNVTVTWTLPADNGSPINRWFFDWYNPSTDKWTRPSVADSTGTKTSHTLTNIPTGATQLRMLAQNNPGPSTWSQTVNITG